MFRIFSSNLGLGLSLLSVVLGIAVGLYQGAWLPMLLCAVPFALLFWCLAWLKRRKYVVKTDALTEGFLATAVKPVSYPHCAGPELTQVCGRSLAGFASLHLKAAIQHLRARVRKRQTEVDREATFTPRKLLSHLVKSCSLLATLQSHMRSLAVQCTCLSDEAQKIYQALSCFYEEFDDRVVRPMKDLLTGVADWEAHDDEIRTFLRDEIGTYLESLGERLGQLVAEAEHLHQQMRDQYTTGVARTHSDEFCKPAPLKPPGVPLQIVKFLDSLA